MSIENEAVFSVDSFLSISELGTLKKIDFELKCFNRNFQSLRFNFGDMVDLVKFEIVCLEKTLPIDAFSNYAIEMFRNGKSVDLMYCNKMALTEIKEIETNE